jgi:hypothetical protein
MDRQLPGGAAVENQRAEPKAASTIPNSNTPTTQIIKLLRIARTNAILGNSLSQDSSLNAEEQDRIVPNRPERL